MDEGRCRFCETPLRHVFADLGATPLCESFLSEEELDRMEPFYPLRAHVCDACLLVQLKEYVRPAEIFSDYAYFSSYSTSWLAHARDYTEMIVRRLGLGARSRVVEIASNDGYLLQYFREKGVPALGVEPAANVAKVAIERGIPTVIAFFGRESARELVARHGPADLLIGNNVLAQVPDLNDFVGGIKVALKPGGVVTIEFPHLVRLIEENQFDTIYHEHFSYFSFTTAEAIFARHGLTLFDVEELPTHGGSLRIYARHGEETSHPVGDRVGKMRQAEAAAGYRRLDPYLAFQPRIDQVKRDLLLLLIRAKEEGKRIVGYGAPGKGNTLLNFCGIRTDFLDYTVDRNPHKQGKYLPGTRIPIRHPDAIAETRPDYVLILPWNLRNEIMTQLASIREWGGRFLVPIPRPTAYA